MDTSTTRHKMIPRNTTYHHMIHQHTIYHALQHDTTPHTHTTHHRTTTLHITHHCTTHHHTSSLTPRTPELSHFTTCTTHKHTSRLTPPHHALQHHHTTHHHTTHHHTTHHLTTRHDTSLMGLQCIAISQAYWKASECWCRPRPCLPMIPSLMLYGEPCRGTPWGDSLWWQHWTQGPQHLADTALHSSHYEVYTPLPSLSSIHAPWFQFHA